MMKRQVQLDGKMTRLGMNVVCFAAVCALVLGLSSSVSASVLAVDWGGDFGVNTANLNLPTPTYTSGNLVETYEYSDTNAWTPLTNYTAPAGTSSDFYGVLQVTTDIDDGAIQQAVVTNSDNLQIYDSGDNALLQGMVFFKKEDFLNGADAAGESLSFKAGNQISMYLYGTTNSNIPTYRAAVLDGSQWYLSEAAETITSIGYVDFITDPTSSNWASYDPTGTTLAATPVSFAAHTFTDIQAVGVYFDAADTSHSDGLIVVRSFETTLTIPEPSTGIIVCLLTGAVVTARGRRRRQTPSTQQTTLA